MNISQNIMHPEIEKSCSLVLILRFVMFGYWGAVCLGNEMVTTLQRQTFFASSSAARGEISGSR
ncbi:uncharacterized protein J3R85_012139 [Psidium guajava]|nr:uncharacterized protein J3R85_012139 [Psidium guajava]